MVSDVIALKPYTAFPTGTIGSNERLFRRCDAAALRLRSVVNS